MDRGDSGQPAGIQRLSAGVRRGHLGPLKRIDVEPDFDVWKEYAYEKGIHPAVLTYLEIKKGNFYRIESTVDGKSFVTARGWDDLSRMMLMYEKRGRTVDEKLVGQYLQNKKIARDFALYYDLFNKYRSDYQVDSILAGKASAEIKERAKAAKFDERLALLGLILDAVTGRLREVMDTDMLILYLKGELQSYRTALSNEKPASPAERMHEQVKDRKRFLEDGQRASYLSHEQQRRNAQLIKILEDLERAVAPESDGAAAFQIVKQSYEKRVGELQKVARRGEMHFPTRSSSARRSSGMDRRC